MTHSNFWNHSETTSIPQRLPDLYIATGDIDWSSDLAFSPLSSGSDEDLDSSEYPQAKQWITKTSLAAQTSIGFARSFQQSNHGDRDLRRIWDGSDSAANLILSYDATGHFTQAPPSLGPSFCQDYGEDSALLPISETRLNSRYFPPQLDVFADSFTPRSVALLDLPMKARFFVIKSFTELDIHKALQHNIWSSTTLGNARLNAAYTSQPKHAIYLFFSVNGSGHFCAMAEMVSEVSDVDSTIWTTPGKWKGHFKVAFHYVKSIPNSSLRHMTCGGDKPMTCSRDTQELDYTTGRRVFEIFSA